MAIFFTRFLAGFLEFLGVFVTLFSVSLVSVIGTPNGLSFLVEVERSIVVAIIVIAQSCCWR